MIRAVLWDFDGTLVDSPPAVLAATDAALVELGFAPVADLDAIRAGMRLPTAPRLAHHAGIAADDPRAEPLAAAFYRHARACFPRLARPVPGILAVLSALAVPQAVVSNNEGALIRATLRAWGVLDRFASVLGDGDLPAPKPDPRGAWMAAAACAVAPAACAYVGDSAVDAETAAAAGMRAIAVAWGTTPAAALAGFDAVVEHPAQLLALMGA